MKPHEISLYNHRNREHINVGEDAEERTPSDISGGSGRWDSYSGKRIGIFLYN